MADSSNRRRRSPPRNVVGVSRSSSSLSSASASGRSAARRPAPDAANQRSHQSTRRLTSTTAEMMLSGIAMRTQFGEEGGPDEAGGGGGQETPQPLSRPIRTTSSPMPMPSLTEAERTTAAVRARDAKEKVRRTSLDFNEIGDHHVAERRRGDGGGPGSGTGSGSDDVSSSSKSHFSTSSVLGFHGGRRASELSTTAAFDDEDDSSGSGGGGDSPGKVEGKLTKMGHDSLTFLDVPTMSRDEVDAEEEHIAELPTKPDPGNSGGSGNLGDSTGSNLSASLFSTAHGSGGLESAAAATGGGIGGTGLRFADLGESVRGFSIYMGGEPSSRFGGLRKSLSSLGESLRSSSGGGRGGKSEGGGGGGGELRFGFGRGGLAEAGKSASVKSDASMASAAWLDASRRNKQQRRNKSSPRETGAMSAASTAWREAWSVPEDEDEDCDHLEKEGGGGERDFVEVKKARVPGTASGICNGRRPIFACVAAAVVLAAALAVALVLLLDRGGSDSGGGAQPASADSGSDSTISSREPNGGDSPSWNAPPSVPSELGPSCSEGSPVFSLAQCDKLCGEAECCFLPHWHARHCGQSQTTARANRDQVDDDACETFDEMCSEALKNEHRDGRPDDASQASSVQGASANYGDNGGMRG